jgi:hypothetical protein
MVSRIVTGLVTVVAAVGLAGPAWADPSADPTTPDPMVADPALAPPLPNVNAYTPVSPVDYTVMNGNWYAFAATPEITCVLDRQNNSYGCSGPLPGAPGGANLVSGGSSGAPGFSTTGRPLYTAAGAAKPLQPNTRLSFRDISCGVDGAGTTACINSREQIGFVITPTGTFISGSNPLVERPEGGNPYLNPMPG